MQVQQVHKKDQSIALNMRGAKLRKLTHGTVVAVPALCIRRTASHFVAMHDVGVHIVTGCNGWLWVGALDTSEKACTPAEKRPFASDDAAEAAEPFKATAAQWLAVATYCAAARALAQLRLPVHHAALQRVVTLAADRGVHCVDMLHLDFLSEVVQLEVAARAQAADAMDVG